MDAIGRVAIWGLGLTLLLPPGAVAQAPWGGSLSVGRAAEDVSVLPPIEGQPSVSASAYRRVARGMAVGLEAGYHRSRHSTIIYRSGSATVHDFSQASAWRVTPTVRLQPFGDRLRPYVVLGIGIYGCRDRMKREEWTESGRMVATSSSDFSTGVQAGWLVGLGLDVFPGRWPIGIGLGMRIHAPRDANSFGTAELGIAWRFTFGGRGRRLLSDRHLSP